MKRLIGKLKSTYNNYKIQKKLTLSHIIVLSIPMIALLVVFGAKFSDMIISDTIRKEQVASTKTAPLIEDKLNTIVAAHDELIAEPFFKQIVNPYRQTSFEKLGNTTAATRFHNLTTKLLEEGNITAVKLFVDLPLTDGVFNASKVSNEMLPISSAMGTYWHGIFKGDPTITSLFCPSFYLSSNEIERFGSMAYITKFNITEGNAYHSCYMAIYFPTELLQGILEENLSLNTTVAYIINDRNSIVAASNLAEAGAYHFSYEEVEDQFMSTNNFITKNMVGEKVYAGFYKFRTPNWYYVVAMPSRPLQAKSILYIVVFILGYLFSIIIAFLLATKLSKSLTNRLSLVSAQMEKATTSLPVPLPPAKETDEIGDMINAYNYMSTVIRKLSKQQQVAAEELRIAEFNSLQAQINPHFLYNTMDMINWLAKKGKTDEVTKAIQKLSKFYKLTLSKKGSFSTIGDEIDHVSIYVELQNMRFDDSINFIVDLSDDLLNYPIPKLTLQPLVENSILHGILEKDTPTGTIVITGWAKDDLITLLISDNGIGMDAETLAHILDSKESIPGKQGSNIAIYNTNQRIKVIYGKEYGLHYQSTKGAGTEVELKLKAAIKD
ncbi:MAG TPA: sensor histidine kinase [Candidatus Dorea intestinavium]|nr:sensor histidine kinase [Candidatus Dorea intestinavium]